MSVPSLASASWRVCVASTACLSVASLARLDLLGLVGGLLAGIVEVGLLGLRSSTAWSYSSVVAAPVLTATRDSWSRARLSVTPAVLLNIGLAPPVPAPM